MAKIIINLFRGIVDSVYSDSPEDLQIEICDSDHEYDEVRANRYETLQHLLKHGGFRPLELDEDLEVPDDKTPCLDANVFLLVKNQKKAKTKLGQNMQFLSAAFLDGYLSAHAETKRCITKLYREQRPEAQMIYAALRPLLDRQNSNYDMLCADLNKPELFDDVDDDEGKKGSL